MPDPWLQDADVTLYHGDALQVLRELPDESVDCCVTSPPSDSDAVEFLRANEARFHDRAEFGGTGSGTGMSTPPGDASDLTFLLSRSQGEAVLSLCSLDSQVGQERGERGCGFAISLPPVPQRTPTFGAWIGDTDVSTESLGEEFERSSFDLADVDAFAVARLSRVTDHSDGVRVALDADGPIRIEDTSEVRESCFVHSPILPGGGDVTRGGDA